MITKQVKRPFFIGSRRVVSVRDYDVKRAVELGTSMRIECQGESMTVPLTQLQQAQGTGRILTSKINPNQTYQLVDFDWKPNDPLNQLTFFIGRTQ